MTDRATFLAEMDLAAAEVPSPDRDPVEFYLTQLREASTNANKTYHHVRFGRAKIEDTRRWLIQIAARTYKAWLETFIPRKPRKEKDLVSTIEALELLQQITGFVYTRQMISMMVRHKELRIAGKQRLNRTGRPNNFFLRTEVMAAGSRRLGNEGLCHYIGCMKQPGHNGKHVRAE